MTKQFGKYNQKNMINALLNPLLTLNNRTLQCLLVTVLENIVSHIKIAYFLIPLIPYLITSLALTKTKKVPKE